MFGVDFQSNHCIGLNSDVELQAVSGSQIRSTTQVAIAQEVKRDWGSIALLVAAIAFAVIVVAGSIAAGVFCPPLGICLGACMGLCALMFVIMAIANLHSNRNEQINAGKLHTSPIQV